AAAEAVLVAEPLPDAVGGVPLLLGGGLVGVQDGPDDGQDGVDLRPPRRPAPPVTRRLLVGQDLLEGQPVDLVLAAGLALADLAGEDTAADLGPLLHVGVHLGAS